MQRLGIPFSKKVIDLKFSTHKEVAWRQNTRVPDIEHQLRIVCIQRLDSEIVDQYTYKQWSYV